MQLRTDERKRFTWPVYLVGLRARFECPACVLVVTPSEAVADWARAPIVLGPGSRVEPLVVGPSAVPLVHDLDAAKRDPELAVLSAMAHGPGASAAEVGLAAIAAAAGLDEARAATTTSSSPRSARPLASRWRTSWLPRSTSTRATS